MTTTIRDVRRRTAVAAILIGCHGALAETITVPDPPNSILTIQDAINAAHSADDDVLVLPGTYTESIDFLGKNIAVRSSDGPLTTILRSDAAAVAVVTFSNNETRNARLEGFTIRPANGHNASAIRCDGATPTIADCIIEDHGADATLGAGVQAINGADPRIQDVIFRNNHAAQGGAVGCVLADAEIIRCRFENNDAAVSGGAVAALLGQLTVTECEFLNNTSELGGALYAAGAAIAVNASNFRGNSTTAATSASGGALRLLDVPNANITDCDFIDNHAAGSGGAIAISGEADGAELRNLTFNDNTAATGGALHINAATGHVAIRNAEFNRNHAARGGAADLISADVSICIASFTDNDAEARGGALHAESTELQIVSARFADNHAATDGGAMRLRTTDALIANSELIRNTAASAGGALSLAGNANTNVVNATIADNQAPTAPAIDIINAAHTLDVANAVLWSHPPNPIRWLGAPPTINNACIQYGWTGPGADNISVDPRFTRPHAADYRICTNSPCRDAGDNDHIPADEFDMDDDMNAFEMLPIDLMGDPRIIDGVVDIGAHETRAPISHDVPGIAPTIQQAIDHPDVLPGDEIRLDVGDHPGPVRFNGKPLRITGQGHASTAITGQPGLPVVTIDDFEGACSELADLTITGGDAPNGGGLFVRNAHAQLRNLHFTENHAGAGGGVYAENAQLHINHATFMNNTINDAGAAIYIASGTVHADALTALDASAPTFGGAIFNNGELTLTNAILARCHANVLGGAIFSSGELTLINAALLDNTALLGAGVYATGNALITNTILFANADASGVTPLAQARNANERIPTPYCLVHNLNPADADPGAFHDEPRFEDATADDYRPAPESPLIDAGDATAIPDNITEDADGNPRVIDALAYPDAGVPDDMNRTIDIGPFEAPADIAPNACPGDVTGDQQVNFDDLNVLLDQWGETHPDADLDDSGVVDFNDLNQLLDAWGDDCN